MQRLVNKMVELIELARDMTDDDYEYWQQETLQQCPEEQSKIVKLLFEVINKYR